MWEFLVLGKASISWLRSSNGIQQISPFEVRLIKERESSKSKREDISAPNRMPRIVLV